jgi:hypothetical protein
LPSLRSRCAIGVFVRPSPCRAAPAVMPRPEPDAVRRIRVTLPGACEGGRVTGAGAAIVRGAVAIGPRGCRIGVVLPKVIAVPPMTRDPASARASTDPPVTAADSKVGTVIPAGASAGAGAGLGFPRAGLRRMASSQLTTAAGSAVLHLVSARGRHG